MASLHCPIRISHSVILQTHEWITDTIVSSVDNFNNADLIASREPFVSDFKIIFNCFKFHAFILDISISKLEALHHFSFKTSSLYCKAFSFAISGELTFCRISHP
jgi:hypothetical protein